MNDGQLIKEIRVGNEVLTDPPSVSVIIPNYNTAEFIAETLDSVLAQTFTAYEIIVVNDASPDTEELNSVLLDYRDQITLIDKTLNEGTSAARNLGVQYARGDLLAFLDADDIWSPSFLEELHSFLSANDFGMAYAAAETFGLNRIASANFLENNPEQGEIGRAQLIDGKCLILPSGTLIKKSVFVDSDGFDPSIARTEDFDLWMRMIFNGTRIGYLQKNLFKFRLRPGSGSGDSVQRIERNRNIWISLKEKLPFTEEEKQKIDLHIAEGDADILRAKGRVCIVQKDWDGARLAFRQAYALARKLRLPLKHRLKIALVLVLLYVCPSVLFRLLVGFRSDEVQFMPTDTP